MPTTPYFTITYVTPFDPAYIDLWGTPVNNAFIALDAIGGRLQYTATLPAIAETHRLITNTRWPLNIDQITVETDAGTLTANLKIESTGVTSLDAIACTTSEQSVSATGANAMAIGNNLSLTITSVVTATKLYVNVWCDRTAAGTA